jgi:predicted dehydrogenase
MLKVCLIGVSGHSGYALEGIAADSGAVLAGIAPGSEGEDIGPVFESVCREGGSPARYENYIQMLDEQKPDIAVVDCFFGDHASVAVEALKRGCHLFVEKPIATTLEDLEKFKAEYAKSDRQLAGMFALRYSPAFLAAWEAVKRGTIGEVRLLNAQKSYRLGTRGALYRKRDLYGGTIPWVGSHAIDWVYWFSGEKFVSVYASHSTKYNNGYEDLEASACCLYRLTNEVAATVNMDYLRPDSAPTHGDDRIRVVGSKGILEVRDGNVFLTGGEDGSGIRQLETAPERNIFRDFMDQIRGCGQCLISAEETVYVSEICIKSRISADENRLISFDR